MTLRERPADELISLGLYSRGGSEKKFLLKEWERAKEGVVTPNCRVKCSGCGAASYKGGVCIESKN